MKAKHAIARIKGLSIWQKIFCTLIALSLTALMIPNGLRANAATTNDNANEAQDKGVTTVNSNANNSILDYLVPKLGSALTIDAKSLNADQTNGYFKVQTAKVTVEQLAYFFTNEVKPPRDYINSLTADENGNVSEQDIAAFFAEALGAAPFLPFGQLDYYEQEVHGSYTIDMNNAIEIPEFLIDLIENVYPFPDLEEADDLDDYISQLETYGAVMLGAEVARNGLNTLIPSNTDYVFQYNPLDPPNSPATAWPDWPFTNDGSMFMLNMYLGEGSTILDALKGANLTFTRIVPVFPTSIPNIPDFRSNGLLGSNGQDNSANVAPYFANWDVDLYGDGYSMPLSMWQAMFGSISVELPYVTGEWLLDIDVVWKDTDIFNHKPLKIHRETNPHITGNFWDIEGLVPVHLDFGNAYVWEGMRMLLRDEGWTSTDFIKGSTWTKYYWEDTPTWFVYQDIMVNYGPWIFGGDKPREITGYELNTKNAVYADSLIYDEYWNKVMSTGPRLFPAWEKVPFPGPNWVNIDNDNWFGTLDKETTFSFSSYAVSPRGHVVHQGHGDNIIEYIFDVADAVDGAFVMLYNEWDMPLFSFMDYRYDKTASFGWRSADTYYFGKGDLATDPDAFIPDYCYDTQIDHATVYAWDDGTTSIIHPIPDIYIPLRVNWDQFDASFATLFDYGFLDFSVERLMFADVAKYMNNAGIENFEVTYYEDGQPLFEPQIVDARYTGLLGIPMVTNGTITTGDNRLVTGWNAYMDFVNPFGNTDPLTAFQDQRNYKASDGNHWFQCQIKANMKPGFAFTKWMYDYAPISADTYKGEPEIIVKEPGIIINHSIMAGFAQVAAVENADGTAIYGDDAAGLAIYGDEATAPVNAAPDGSAPVIAANPNSGTAQTGDTAPLAPIAALAIVAALGCCLSIRKSLR